MDFDFGIESLEKFIDDNVSRLVSVDAANGEFILDAIDPSREMWMLIIGTAYPFVKGI